MDGVGVVNTSLERKTTPLVSKIEMDDLTNELIAPFDYQSDGVEVFYPFFVPKDLPQTYNLGVIVGASGTGKSTLLQEFGDVEKQPQWLKEKSIASHFENANDAAERLSAAGLMSIPEWVKSFDSLSNGQKFRANLARQLKNNAVIDEFTSVVDRNVAKSASVAMSRYIKKNEIQKVVLATCHRDVLEYLEPDWVIDTDRGEWYSGRSLRRPNLVLTIYPSNWRIWNNFSRHHYLSQKLNTASHNFIAVWEGKLVGFISVMAFPSGTLTNAFREHRLVIDPDFQGFGFGHILSESVAQIYRDNGKRFFSKTSHPRLGEYRDNSDLWKPTSKNHLIRKDGQNSNLTRWKINPNRWSYSHEYIGVNND